MDSKEQHKRFRDAQAWVGLRFPIILAAVAGIIYIWAGPNQSNTDGWFPLAASMLHGHLTIGPEPWIETVPAGGGHFYLPFPPVPAVVLMPIVALFGQTFIDTSACTGFIGGLNVLLAWFVVRRYVAPREARWLTFAFAFGSEALWVAAFGGVHLWTETLGMSFELAALALAVRGRWPLAAGFLLLLAAGCRPTYLMAAPAFLLLYAPAFSRRTLERFAWFAVGAAPIALLLVAYNMARFGDPFDFGYARIVSQYTGASVLSERWYAHGIMSPLYITGGLQTMFASLPRIVGQFPWVRPSWGGVSILLTRPVLVNLVKARGRSRTVVAAWLGLALPLLFDFMHGETGAAQFGYRFFLDGLPFAWLLLAIVVARSGLTWPMRLLLLAGVAVNAYGLCCTTVGFVG
jgi:hypothetical protein